MQRRTLIICQSQGLFKITPNNSLFLLSFKQLFFLCLTTLFRQAEVMADMMTFAVQSYQYVGDSFERSSRKSGTYDPAGHVSTDDWNNALAIQG